MKPVHLCVPVLKRYDLLRDMLLSLKESSVKPAEVHIVDNGRSPDRVRDAIAGTGLSFDVFTPEAPMGVAESWNWFIDNVPEERVIANDDLVFAPHSLERLLASSADLAWAEGCGFSCFLLRDRCVDVIGVFDESISPGYGYYEDEDYLQRLDGKGTRSPSVVIETIPCGILHVKSGTMEGYTDAEMREHHRRFAIARMNYMRKWGLETL